VALAFAWAEEAPGLSSGCEILSSQLGGLVRHAPDESEGGIAIVTHRGAQEARVAVAVFVADGDPQERTAELAMVGVRA
jgi:hypothetical protein